MVYGIAFYISVVVPVAAILLFNTVILTVVTYKLHQNSKKKATNLSNQNKDKNLDIKRLVSEARIAFACNILLGITWIFALLAVGKATMVFQWFFCVFNSLQGFFIFLFYTVRSQDVRKAWAEKIKRKKPISSQPKKESSSRTDRKGNPCTYDVLRFFLALQKMCKNSSCPQRVFSRVRPESKILSLYIKTRVSEIPRQSELMCGVSAVF